MSAMSNADLCNLCEQSMLASKRDGCPIDGCVWKQSPGDGFPSYEDLLAELSASHEAERRLLERYTKALNQRDGLYAALDESRAHMAACHRAGQPPSTEAICRAQQALTSVGEL